MSAKNSLFVGLNYSNLSSKYFQFRNNLQLCFDSLIFEKLSNKQLQSFILYIPSSISPDYLYYLLIFIISFLLDY
jgi:hypothetical protein